MEELKHWAREPDEATASGRGGGGGGGGAEAAASKQQPLAAEAAKEARPLKNRRGFAINIDEWRRNAGVSAEGRGNLSNSENTTPKLEPPAVLCDANQDTNVVRTQTPKKMLHPLPGAFSNSRTLIFFDWDDTLCPTSWIRGILKDHMADQWEWAFGDDTVDMDWQYSIPAWFGQPLPDLPHVKDAICNLQDAVISVINKAQTLGVVCIVTNAYDGWVDKTTRKWLPKLKQYILGHGARPPITVLYGQQEYRRSPASSSRLDWVDDLGELMWWKKVAMVNALERIDDLYRVDGMSMLPPPMTSPTLGPLRSMSAPLSTASAIAAAAASSEEADGEASAEDEDPFPRSAWLADRGAKRVVNVVSIGDSEAEMQSSLLAALTQQVGVTGTPDLPGLRRASGLKDSNDAPSTNGVGTSKETAAPRRPSSALAGQRLPSQPWVKNVKLEEAPSVDRIIEQLELLKRALPILVAERSHLRVGPEELQTMIASSSTSEDSQACLHRLLRTQSA